MAADLEHGSQRMGEGHGEDGNDHDRNRPREYEQQPAAHSQVRKSYPRRQPLRIPVPGRSRIESERVLEDVGTLAWLPGPPCIILPGGRQYGRVIYGSIIPFRPGSIVSQNIGTGHVAELDPDRIDALVDRHRGDIQLLRDLLGRQMLAGQPQGFILLFGKRVEDGMDIVPIHGAHLRYRAEGSNSKCQGGIT